MKWDAERKTWTRRGFTKEDAAWVIGMVIVVCTTAMIFGSIDKGDIGMVAVELMQFYFGAALAGWGSHRPNRKEESK